MVIISLFKKSINKSIQAVRENPILLTSGKGDGRMTDTPIILCSWASVGISFKTVPFYLRTKRLDQPRYSKHTSKWKMYETNLYCFIVWKYIGYLSLSSWMWTQSLKTCWTHYFQQKHRRYFSTQDSSLS